MFETIRENTQPESLCICEHPSRVAHNRFKFSATSSNSTPTNTATQSLRPLGPGHAV